MAVKLQRDVIVRSKFLTRKNDLTNEISTVISPNRFQVGLSGSLSSPFASDLTVYGPGKFHGGVSGSLTQLIDGTSYLVAGDNVTITSASNGAVTISHADATGNPGGSTTQVQFNDAGAFGGNANFVFNKVNGDVKIGGSTGTSELQFRAQTQKIYSPLANTLAIDATNQVQILSGGAVASFNEAGGEDVSFYVSGSVGSRGSSDRGTAVFGGDMVVSGGMYINLSSNAAADFRVETDGEDEALFIDASSNTLFINRGATSFITIVKNTADEVLAVKSAGLVVNENGNASVDTRIETDNKASAVFVDAGKDKIAFLEASAAPTFGNDTAFLVSGSIGSRGSLTDTGTAVFRGDVYTSGSMHISGSSTIAADVPKLSVGCSSTTPPKTALDVTYDYKTHGFENLLAAGEGGGNRLLVGNFAASVSVAGRVFYYSAGLWRAADADNANTMQLLGIALDVDGGADEGLVLLQGFVRVPATSVLNGAGSSADLGDPVYVSTTASKWDFTAPSAGGDYKRFIGYCVDYDSSSGDYLMWFNPDNYTQAL